MHSSGQKQSFGRRKLEKKFMKNNKEAWNFDAILDFGSDKAWFCIFCKFVVMWKLNLNQKLKSHASQNKDE